MLSGELEVCNRLRDKSPTILLRARKRSNRSPRDHADPSADPPVEAAWKRGFKPGNGAPEDWIWTGIRWIRVSKAVYREESRRGRPDEQTAESNGRVLRKISMKQGRTASPLSVCEKMRGKTEIDLSRSARRSLVPRHHPQTSTC
jgi:hypothetical protein